MFRKFRSNYKFYPRNEKILGSTPRKKKPSRDGFFCANTFL